MKQGLTIDQNKAITNQCPSGVSSESAKDYSEIL